MATFPDEFPWGLGGDGTSSVPPTAESETFRLAQYIKGKPNMEAILARAIGHREGSTMTADRYEKMQVPPMVVIPYAFT